MPANCAKNCRMPATPTKSDAAVDRREEPLLVHRLAEGQQREEAQQQELRESEVQLIAANRAVAAVIDSRLPMQPIGGEDEQREHAALVQHQRAAQHPECAPHSKPIGPTRLSGSSPMGSAKRCSSKRGQQDDDGEPDRVRRPRRPSPPPRAWRRHGRGRALPAIVGAPAPAVRRKRSPHARTTGGARPRGRCRGARGGPAASIRAPTAPRAVSESGQERSRSRVRRGRSQRPARIPPGATHSSANGGGSVAH